MDQKYLILAGCWALYFIVHSLTATLWFKRYFEDLGISKTTYRKVYVLISIAGLLGILVYNSTIKEGYLIQPVSAMKYGSLILAGAGTVVIRLAFKEYRLREFLGLVNENPGAEFKLGGILAHVRHPLYSATILIVAGFLMYSPRMSTLIMVISVMVYLIFGIYLEERKLIKEFGERYIEYKRRVPSIVPRIKGLI